MKAFFTIILCITNFVVVKAQDKSHITVYAPVLAPDDTLELYIQPERIHLHFLNPATVLSAGNKNGYFHFEIPLDHKYAWLSMHLSYQYMSGVFIPTILDEYLLSAEDSVSVYLTPKNGVYQSVESGYDGGIPIVNEYWDVRFLGRGAAKYQALQEIKYIGQSKNRQQVREGFSEDYPVKQFLTLQQLERESLEVLNKYKERIPSAVYQLLTAQVKGQYGYELGRTLETGYFYFGKEETVPMFRKELEQYFIRADKDLQEGPELYALAPKYVAYLAKYGWLRYSDAKKTHGFEGHWYYLIKDLLPASSIADRTLASVLMESFSYKPDRVVLEDALETIIDPYANKQVSLLKNILKGIPAYDFSLPDVDGVYHKLSDYKGKVLFIDFWFASCSPCRQYMQDVVGPVKAHFKDNPDVVFVTVSIDDHHTFEKMLQQADFLPKGGVHLYTDNQYTKHPIIEHYQIRGYPQPFLISRDAKVLAGKQELRSLKGLIKEINTALSR